MKTEGKKDCPRHSPSFQPSGFLCTASRFFSSRLHDRIVFDVGGGTNLVVLSITVSWALLPPVLFRDHFMNTLNDAQFLSTRQDSQLTFFHVLTVGLLFVRSSSSPIGSFLLCPEPSSSHLLPVVAQYFSPQYLKVRPSRLHAPLLTSLVSGSCSMRTSQSPSMAAKLPSSLIFRGKVMAAVLHFFVGTAMADIVSCFRVRKKCCREDTSQSHLARHAVQKRKDRRRQDKDLKFGSSVNYVLPSYSFCLVDNKNKCLLSFHFCHSHLQCGTSLASVSGCSC